VSEPLPNSRDCYVCGIDNPRGWRLKFHRANGRVYTRVTLPDWAVGFRGVGHGGLVATLLDEVMSWAATCEARGPTATGEMTVRFRQPTPVGEELLLEAEVVKARGLLLYVEGRLLRLDGTVCAGSTGKHMRLPESSKSDFELAYEPGDSRILEDE
jgi:acyl-coenzyme A thioesterase PaaI-like protein